MLTPLYVRRWFALFLFLACPVLAFAGGQLPNGSPVSGSITNSGTTPIPSESWTFQGKAGEFASIAFVVTDSPKNASLCLLFHQPDESTYGCNYGSFTRNALGLTGTYTVEVVWGSGAPSTVSYQMTLAEAGSSFAGSLVGNGASTLGSLANAGTLAEYTAYIPAGVSFFAAVGTTTQAGGSMGMQITDPNGVQLLSGFYTDYNNVNALTSVGGYYRFVLYGASGLTKIGYRFTVAVGGIYPASLAGGDAISDGTYPGSIGHGVLDQWPFNTAAGQQVIVSIAAASGNPQGAGIGFDIFDPKGAKLFSGLTSNWRFTPATGGEYRVVIYRADSGSGAYFDNALYRLTLSGSVAAPACPVSVRPTPASYEGITPTPFIQATFIAPTGAKLTDYAKTCSFDHFNWQQQITVDPGERTIIPRIPSNVPDNVLPAACSTIPAAMWPATSCVLVAGPASLTNLGGSYPSYYDPPDGGFTGDVYTKYPSYNPYPFVYPTDAVTSPGAACAFPSFCPPFPFVLSSDSETLTFLDAPAHGSLPGDPPSATPAPGHFIAFLTSLVGVDAYGKAHTLFSWTWNSTFNGKATDGGVTCLLGCAQTVGVAPIIPGSGTGGVTITSINGVQLPVAIPPTQITVTSSGLAYSRVSQTFNGTMILTNTGGSAINGPLQVVFFGMPINVTLVNTTNNLSGTPYLTVPATTSLAPGQSASVNVQFRNPSNAEINLTPVIYSGSIN